MCNKSLDLIQESNTQNVTHILKKMYTQCLNNTKKEIKIKTQKHFKNTDSPSLKKV